jgi:hypothetical protein
LAFLLLLRQGKRSGKRAGKGLKLGVKRRREVLEPRVRAWGCVLWQDRKSTFPDLEIVIFGKTKRADAGVYIGEFSWRRGHGFERIRHGNAGILAWWSPCPLRTSNERRNMTGGVAMSEKEKK